MMDRLPNLDWLRVFAAAAETESFAVAAQRLGVTPSAVSQRLKALETYLGTPLFRRHAQGVVLTDAGRRFARRIRPPLDLLASATRDILAVRGPAPLRVTVLPAFAQLWLGPRMADFHRQSLGTAVEIWADATVVDLCNSNFDVALRYGVPPFAGCDAIPLLRDELVPVASPALLARSETDESGLPVDASLMLDTYWPNDFDDWLAHTGNAHAAHPKVQTFSLYSMAVEAVLDGQGFMIGHTALVGDLVAQGRLQVLSDRRITGAKQFYIVTCAGRPLTDRAGAFIEWLLGQCKTPD